MMMKATRRPDSRQSSPPSPRNVPQIHVDVDRMKAKSMGVPLSDVFDTLQIYLGIAVCE